MKAPQLKLKLDKPIGNADYLVVEVGGRGDQPEHLCFCLHKRTPKTTTAVRGSNRMFRKILWYEYPDTVPDHIQGQYNHVLEPSFDMSKTFDGRAWDIVYLTSLLPTIRADFETVYPELRIQSSAPRRTERVDQELDKVLSMLKNRPATGATPAVVAKRFGWTHTKAMARLEQLGRDGKVYKVPLKHHRKTKRYFAVEESS